MKNRAKQNIVAWILMILGIAVAYKGYVITAVLFGTLAIMFCTVKEVTFFGDEEEPNDEEES